MLLPPSLTPGGHTHRLSLPLQTLADPFSPSLPLPICPKPLLLFRNPRPSKPLPIICCSALHSQTLPKSAIQRVADKLRSLGYAAEEDLKQTHKSEIEPEPGFGSNGSAGEIFVPLPRQLPISRVGHTIDSSWSTPGNPVPEPGSGGVVSRLYELSREVKKQKRELVKEGKEEKVPTLAERVLPTAELRRLQGVGIALKKKLKIGKAGITEGVVNGIHERWRRAELVKVECEDLCRMNMKRTHDLLERKTGGLVVWRSGSKIILYRGPNYEYPYFSYKKDLASEKPSGSASISCQEDGEHNIEERCVYGIDGFKTSESSLSNEVAQASLIEGIGSPDRVRFQLPGEEQLAAEADSLLDGLGPRFTDWWGCAPLPVDADLLPEVVAGYRRPFRLLPYGVKPKLTNDEMTILRRLGRPLPCHFALGRNRKHQGLAASIVNLWEKCEIAKIAIKKGVQNTNSEIMADELRRLTGGTLLSRDKDFIVLYRGKDFLPPAVSSAIEERRKSVLGRKRVDCGSSVISKLGTTESASELEIEKKIDQKKFDLSEKKKMLSSTAIERTSIRLSGALEKRAQAEKLLLELEKKQTPEQLNVDREGITEEEKYMLRRVGFKMKPFLLLGKRGVFDGTVENMHLHWKYRELVKILCNQKCSEDAQAVARTLEAESGGVLVAVERVNKGYAIIVYRGKNYRRPATLRPQALLNKREAMKRSIEAQRFQSLKLHVLELTRNIDKLKHQLGKTEEMNMTWSAEESKFNTVDGDKFNNLQSLVYERTDSEHKPDSSSSSVYSACEGENAEADEGCGSVDDDIKYGLDIIQQEVPVEIEDEIDQKNDKELESLSISLPKEHHSDILMMKETKIGDVKCTSSADNVEGCAKRTASESAECLLYGSGKVEPVSKSDIDLESSTCGPSISSSLNGTAVKITELSNKDRLLLRKQALRMKKRPVLAVGRSNIVTGVAKAIMVHFRKHPLAIVNVKARAKGTPIQELVFKLEQATGAVLVCQETNKVILYRGWGAGIGPSSANKVNSRSARKKSFRQGIEVRPTVSPELMAAIRSECGL